MEKVYRSMKAAGASNLTIGIIIVFAALLHNYKGKRFKTTLQTTT